MAKREQPKKPSEMTDKQLAEQIFGKELKGKLDEIAHEKEEPQEKPKRSRKRSGNDSSQE